LVPPISVERVEATSRGCTFIRKATARSMYTLASGAEASWSRSTSTKPGRWRSSFLNRSAAEESTSRSGPRSTHWKSVSSKRVDVRRSG